MTLFDSIAIMAKGKKRRVGRPTREDNGLLPKKKIGTAVDQDVYDTLIKKYGTIVNALNYAASVKN